MSPLKKIPTERWKNWFDKITAQQASKQESDTFVINLQATTSNSSFDMLKQYIDFVSAKVYNDTLANVQALVSAKEYELKQQLKVLRSQASSYLQVEKERTQYALNIASAADVNQPVQNLGDNEIFAINLGAKALAAKVSALESVKNLSVVEPRIQQVEARLSLLQGTELDKNIKFKTYRFLENVEKPVTKDKPKTLTDCSDRHPAGRYAGCGLCSDSLCVQKSRLIANTSNQRRHKQKGQSG
ncbi:hypothetical protein [Photobacterium arenosum]|uniref:hypothetical protein n=1 Tax=Photobacterium arenosum TaxID=2774143 RepID=UPI00288B190C|nr:hypothetical protein [Photobacterium arenosum]